MKPLPTLALALSLASSALADDPKPEPPRSPDWKTWNEASATAKKNLGYVFMLVTPAPKGGKEAPYTTRMLHELSNPAVHIVLNEEFGCWKGSVADAASHADAQERPTVTGKEPPAIVFVDPETGETIDRLPGHGTCEELKAVLAAIGHGTHLANMKKVMQVKANQADTGKQLAYGEALIRDGDAKAARKALEVSVTSKDKREHLLSMAALLRCDMLEEKYEDAIKHADELIPLLPPEGNELKAEARYIKMWAHYRLGKLDECSKVALDLRENFRRATFGNKSVTDVEDYGFDFILKEKVASAR